MKKYAWTLAEMTIAFVIIIALSAFSLNIMKNVNLNKARIFMYAALKNLSAGSAAIIQNEKNNFTFYTNEALESDNNVDIEDDWYCMQLADVFSLKGSANCKKTAAVGDVNFVTANGVSHQGLSSPWILAYGNIYYKNFVIDVDGEKGMNRVGVDRFPMRVLRGINANNVNLEGKIYPVNCTSDKTYDEAHTYIALDTPYCNDGFDASGKSRSYNLLESNEIVSYSIYRVFDETNPREATLVANSLPTIEANCLAYGGASFFPKKLCYNHNFTLHPKCAQADICSTCDVKYNVCPNKGSSADCLDMANKYILEVRSKNDPTKVNRTSSPCFIVPNKPTAALGMIGSFLADEIGL